ncbi:MAG: TFIIB-type zinc ribbon-containing protein [Eubacteriales bacterium]|nr:TFIIB-type zinc ribbon-containing protein [Eubacteriales bacterium]
MAAVTFKCPNCGGDIKFDPASQKYKCEYCTSLFTQEELEASNPQTRKKEEDTSGSEPGVSGERDAHGTAVVYSCPDCGAEIVTDETTAATFCYYCHNPVVLQGKLSGEYKPDLVIPFAVDKKEAVDSFLKYVRSKKFVPADFFCKEQIEKISGIYFPFWMYSCQADGTWKGTGNQIRVYRMGDIEYTETKVFDIQRSADLTFKNLMRDALDKENRQLVEAVQPFRVEGAKNFSMGYLSGFQAEKRNIEKQDLIAGLKQEIQEHAAQMMKASVNGYASASTLSQDVWMHEEDWKYLLLPVWVLTYKGMDGRMYYYAMNGQTKKICGVLPVDKKRVVTLFFGIFVPVLVLLLLGGYFLW